MAMEVDREGPRDPRSRAVTSVSDAGGGALAMKLECGHIARRRPALCPPTRVICRQC
jgi:hypothetical protein